MDLNVFVEQETTNQKKNLKTMGNFKILSITSNKFQALL